jgi:hypothetical protein
MATKSKSKAKPKSAPDDEDLMRKAIDWWHKEYPQSELRPSAEVSAVMRFERSTEWGTGSKMEGPYVLLRSHDGGQALPLHDLTVCGLFRWDGRKLVPMLVIDGNSERSLLGFGLSK